MKSKKSNTLFLLWLSAPTLSIVWIDVLQRHNHLARFPSYYWLAYLGSFLESLLFWGSWLWVCTHENAVLRRIAKATFVFSFTLIVGTQIYFFSIYHSYLSKMTQLYSKSFIFSLTGFLPFEGTASGFYFGIIFSFSIVLVFLEQFLFDHLHDVRNSKTIIFLLAPMFWIATFFVPTSYYIIQSSMPDMIYLHGVGYVVSKSLQMSDDHSLLRVERRHPSVLPSLISKPKKSRNVLLFVQESQRADVTCIEYDSDCKLATRFSNKVSPHRIPFKQLRSNDSTTALSISTIWSGLAPIESKEKLLQAPLLWDYAKAAGWDTAYWTSQNVLFGNARLYIQDISVNNKVFATNLDSMADYDTGSNDSLLVDHVIENWENLKEPFLAVVHFSNIHFPYIYDENNAPFQPSLLTKDPEQIDSFLNYYRNVVYLSDKSVGKLIEYVRSTESGRRTIMIYTSDHGESFREHNQMGHTFSVYDEEIHVPGWLDAPSGTLSKDEESYLKNASNQFLWHLDFAPTILDLMGVWDEPKISKFTIEMMGKPLTRPIINRNPVPLTNCSWIWECEFRNWGYMQGPLKVEAREWDSNYHCFNVLDDPGERTDLGEDACAGLSDLARKIFKRMPNEPSPGLPTP